MMSSYAPNIPSGAKAEADLADVIGTTKVVPFQNADMFSGSLK
jgi:hypothetical protein